LVAGNEPAMIGILTAPETSQLYTWSAGALLGLLAFYETQDWRTGVIWAGFALVLGWFGTRLKRPDLSVQSLLLAAFACAAGLLVNVRSTEMLGGSVSLALVSASAIAVILYVLHRYSPHDQLQPLYTWGGSLLLSWLMWYQLPALSIALAWALFGLVLFEIGITRSSAIGNNLRTQ